MAQFSMKIMRLTGSVLGDNQHYGSFDAFEAETLDLIDEVKLGRDDMWAVLVALRRWHADNVWGGWGQRNSGVYSR